MKMRRWLTALAVAVGFPEAMAQTGEDAARKEMIDTQMRSRGIDNEQVLAAISSVSRADFVPPNLQHRAHEDNPLSIGHGQTISQPYIVALMTQLLDLDPKARVLEIGTGSGYQAAILAHLAAEVYSIEIVGPLAESATKTLDHLGYKNVHVKAGDGYKGWPEAAPFDAIIVTCAPDHIPQLLVEQLREGGRMVIPVGETGGAQELYLLEKIGGKIQKQSVIPVRFVPMTGEAAGS